MVHCASPLFTARAAKELTQYGHRSCAEFPLLAFFGHVAMSDLSPEYEPKRTSTDHSEFIGSRPSSGRSSLRPRIRTVPSRAGLNSFPQLTSGVISGRHEAAEAIAALVQAQVRVCEADMPGAPDRACGAAHRRSRPGRGTSRPDLRYLPAHRPAREDRKAGHHRRYR